MLLLTNNPKVQECHDWAEYVEGSPLKVFNRAEDLILQGYVLYTHPLPANQRLCGSPYRSLLLEEPSGEGVHTPSLMMLTRAKDLFARAVPLDRVASAREDLAFMDYEFIHREVEELPREKRRA
jgi:hypothetical protein